MAYIISPAKDEMWSFVRDKGNQRWQMHDIVIGLFINRYEFGLPI